MRVLSLFSGGGLGDYGLELAGMEIVGQVELDEYCQKILKLRWPEVPKWRDIKSVKGADLPACDLISGGPPCQPFSHAGKRKGAADDRNLWPEMRPIISEVRPSWVLFENNPGVEGYIESDVLPQLEAEGFEAVALGIPAHPFGAWHWRMRWFVVANSNSNRLEGRVRQSVSTKSKYTTPLSTYSQISVDGKKKEFENFLSTSNLNRSNEEFNEQTGGPTK